MRRILFAFVLVGCGELLPESPNDRLAPPVGNELASSSAPRTAGADAAAPSDGGDADAPRASSTSAVDVTSAPDAGAASPPPDAGSATPPPDAGCPRHEDGAGHPFVSCAPLGTFSVSTATQACLAYVAAGGGGQCFQVASPTPSPCADQAVYAYAVPSGVTATWAYAGTFAGKVRFVSGGGWKCPDATTGTSWD